MAKDGIHLPTKEFVANYDSIFRKGKSMAKKNKKKEDKEMKEWNEKVKALGEKNRSKLVSAMRGKNA
jgi:hypothetical protein